MLMITNQNSRVQGYNDDCDDDNDHGKLCDRG